MKVFFSAGLAIYYFLISIGVSVNVHYCGDKVDSVELYGKTKICCCKDNSENSKGCCGDDFFFYQFDENQLSSQLSQSQDEVQSVAALLDYSQEKPAEIILISGLNLDLLNLPPPQQRPLWLMNCSMLYYS